jgi:hypothetical protein
MLSLLFDASLINMQTSSQKTIIYKNQPVLFQFSLYRNEIEFSFIRCTRLGVSQCRSRRTFEVIEKYGWLAISATIWQKCKKIEQETTINYCSFRIKFINIQLTFLEKQFFREVNCFQREKNIHETPYFKGQT